MSVRDKAIATALALCAIAAAALPAPAGAATSGNGYQSARFKIEIKGVQSTIHNRTHEPESSCDISDFSTSRERLSFRSTKPVVVFASYMRGDTNPQFFRTGRQLGIPTVATVKRSFSPAITQPGGLCEDNGGPDDGEHPTPPDCGTKTVKPWVVKLQYSLQKKNGLLLSAGDGKDPYENCPGSNPMFPILQVEGSGHKGKYITADLSPDELFDPQFQKWISVAEGSAKNSSEDWSTKTTVRWEVSFTRLKDETPKSAAARTLKRPGSASEPRIRVAPNVAAAGAGRAAHKQHTH
jgi:hypothetical protein